MLRLEGLPELQAALNKLQAQVPDRAGAAFSARVERDVRDREKFSWRKPLLIVPADGGLVMTVAWLYQRRGDEGEYLSRVVLAASRLMMPGLRRDLVDAVKP